MLKYKHHFKDTLDLATFLQEIQIHNADLLEACKNAVSIMESEGYNTDYSVVEPLKKAIENKEE